MPERFWEYLTVNFLHAADDGKIEKCWGKDNQMKQIYVIHENNTWVEPLREAFAELGLPFAEWFLDSGVINLDAEPPQGVFYNRMSASSHTREHRWASEYTAAVLAWLERHGRRVVNNSQALRLEISKVAQYAALNDTGARTPRTVAAVGRDEIIHASQLCDPPFITKHNRAGKGLGVRLFREREVLVRYVQGDQFEPSVDGITLVQEYIEAPEPFITRVEFVGCRLLYAVKVDASRGFELCPADACQVEDVFCPTGDTSESSTVAVPRFQIIDGFGSECDDAFVRPLIEQYKQVLALHGVEIAGVEFILDSLGVPHTYDINTNTNYNNEAEAVAGMRGMHAVAVYLGGELEAV